MNEIETVEKMLAEPLDENGVNLALQLVTVESWLARISKILYDTGKIRDEMRDKYRVPKSNGLTELDRTVMLDAATADYEARYKYLEALQDTIRRRCTLGQSLLRMLRTEAEAGLR